MKWYHKFVYRAAMSVLPDDIKRQMMGAGRITVPKNANPWNMFNWLPKKFQTAHTIDLTKLQNYTAEELLELLISVHPDVSHAIHTYLRLGDTDLSFSTFNDKGKPDKNGQTVIDELVSMMNNPLDSPGYQHGRSLDKLDGIQRLMVMIRGACAGEVVLNDACTEVIDIVPVDPSTIWFKRDQDTNRLVPWQFVRFPKMKPNETWFGQYKRIDSPTFIYEELDPLVDDPYGRTPILPVLQIVFFHLQVLQDLKAVVHNQGYPRLSVSILEEVMLKNMPAQYKNDPNAQRTWLSNRLTDITNQFSSLNPDDALIFWDSVKTEYLKGSGTGPMIDIKKLIDVIDTQLATALKTLLTMLSRHQGSTETYSSVDTQLYIKTVESARKVTERFWERALQMSARVKGIQTNVEAEYVPIDLRTENELESDRQLRLENLESAESNFYITSEEAAVESRKALGLSDDIPTDLKDRLKQKQEQPRTPPQENPAEPPPPTNVTNRRLNLANDNDDEDNSGDDSSQNDNQNIFIALYLTLMSKVKQNLRHATSLDSILPAMSITPGMQDRLRSGLWQLKRSEYVDSFNQRANAVGTTRIRNPETDKSVEMHQQARNVIEGTTSTYQQNLESAYQQAIEDVKDLPEEQQVAQIKQAMQTWLDENAAYKSVQIAQHETLIAYHEGMLDHDEEHAPETMYVVEPESSAHDACIEIIEGGPYTVTEARSVPLPLHPNCPHHLVPMNM